MTKVSSYETVDRIRRSHRHARPNPSENPAWANCHMDCGVLLQEIDRLRAALEMLEREAGDVADDHHRPRYARLDDALASVRVILYSEQRQPEPSREHVQIDSPSALCGLLGCTRQTPHHHLAVL